MQLPPAQKPPLMSGRPPKIRRMQSEMKKEDAFEASSAVDRSVLCPPLDSSIAKATEDHKPRIMSRPRKANLRLDSCD